jgi:natural product precursor
MKKIRLNSKLSLNKETIARLNDDEMNNVKGGHYPLSDYYGTCYGMCLNNPTAKCFAAPRNAFKLA